MVNNSTGNEHSILIKNNGPWPRHKTLEINFFNNDGITTV